MTDPSHGGQPTPQAFGDFPHHPWLSRDVLTLTRDDAGVAMLTLHSPPANEISTKVLAALEEVVTAVTAEPPRAMVVTSANPSAFSAGADLRELHRELERHLAAGYSIDEGKRQVAVAIDRLHAVMDALDTVPFPTVAAISGVCMGGGFELALTCDLRVADKSARFAFPELRLGLVPGWGGTARLARECGQAILRDLLMTGRTIGAPRAFDLGLVQNPVARGEATMTALRMARQAAHFAPHTVRAAKALTKALPEGALAREKQTFVELFGHPTVREALARFASSTDARPYL